MNLAATLLELQHRGRAVNPDAVRMELVEPEDGAGDQETLHLEAAVVEEQAAPLGVLAPPRVAVLVEVRAVEVNEPVAVGWKLRCREIQDHPDAVLVKCIDQRHEVLG